MDLEFTRDNFFKFGYDHQLFSLRTHANQKWFANYSSAKRVVKGWREECLVTAQEITARHPHRKPCIALSGGIDSEVVAEAFHFAGLEHEIAILRFPDELNSHDIQWAEKYCTRRNKKPIFVDIDPLAFYKTAEFEEIHSTVHSFFPMLALQMKLLERISQMNLLPVLGSAECYLEKDLIRGWVVFEREIFASLYRFQKMRQIEGVCGFFQWNPENMLSFLTDKMVVEMVQGRLVSAKGPVRNSQEIKPLIYGQHFQLESRPKYYGWEKFEELERNLRLLLSKKYQYAATEIKTPYSGVLEQLEFR